MEKERIIMVLHKNRPDHNRTTASVINDTLILTLPDARTPTVWRMALDSASAASFQVLADSGGDGHTLVMSSPDTEKEVIAHFDSRESAVDALLAASGAMQRIEAQSAPATTNQGTMSPHPTPQPATMNLAVKRGRGARTFLTAAGAVLIVILLYMIANTGPERIAPDGRNAETSTSGNTQNSISAEQFLQQRQ